MTAACCHYGNISQRPRHHFFVVTTRYDAHREFRAEQYWDGGLLCGWKNEVATSPSMVKL